MSTPNKRMSKVLILHCQSKQSEGINTTRKQPRALHDLQQTHLWFQAQKYMFVLAACDKELPEEQIQLFYSRTVVDLRAHASHCRAERQNQWPLFTFEQRTPFYWPDKKKSSQHKEQLEEIALLFFTLSQMTLQSLTSFFLIVLKHNVMAPAWFYCPVYLHDWAGREKHHVLLWIVEVCLRSFFFFKLISGLGRKFYQTFVSSAPCKHRLQEWASQLNSLHKLVVPAAPL